MERNTLLVGAVTLMVMAIAGCDTGNEPTGGFINVASDPRCAEIVLDGSATGEVTNTILTEISEDQHTIKLSLSGYEDEEKTVDVVLGDTAYVAIPLTEVPSDPVPVSVEVTGKITLGDWFAYYTYQFNQDVTAANCELTMPGRSTVTIDYVYGAMDGNRLYGILPIGLDNDENFQPQTQIPRGTHILYFEGLSVDGENFSITKEIPLN